MAELTHETVKRLHERIIEMRSDGLMLWTHTLFAYIDQLEEQVAALKAQVERLTAPFTERDVDKLYFVISMFYEDVNKPSREEVVATMNAMLQERAATPAIHPACDHEWRIDTGGECPKCRKERE